MNDAGYIEPRSQTISESPRTQPASYPARSYGKRAASRATANLDVRFAPVSQLALEIRRFTNTTNPNPTDDCNELLMAVHQSTTTMQKL